MKRTRGEKRTYTSPVLVEYGSAVDLTQNARSGTLYEGNGNHVESNERRDSGLHK